MSTVSAIIPTYNRAELLVDALESVLSQSLPVDEIIVVDDGSTDNTVDILRPYDAQVKYIRQSNRGPGAARNRGIREARGEYIAFLDSDDIWMKEKTKMQMDFFMMYPSVEFVFGDMANFTEHDDNEKPEIKNKEIHDYFTAHQAGLDRIFNCLIIENVIPTPTVVFKRQCVSRVGFFDEELEIAEDLDYWLRASLTCRFGFIDAVLAKRRRHDGNLINDWVKMNTALVEVLTRIERSALELPSQTKRLLVEKLYRTRYDLGSHFLKKRDFAKAYTFLKYGVPGQLFNIKWFLKALVSFLLQHYGSNRQR